MELKPGYWENVYRTNKESAYNAGKVMMLDKAKPEAIQLFIIDDERTSDICRHLLREAGTGIILPIDHPFWEKYGYPPYHYQCRTGIRFIYKSQINKDGISLDNPSIQAFNNFKPMKGFGGNPVEKESWWRMTDSMAIRAAEMGIFNEVESFAKLNGLENFSLTLVKGSDYRKLTGTQYSAEKSTSAKPLQKEIAAAKILEDNGHSVYFTPENKSTKNYDAIVDGQTADFKIITSKDIRKIKDRIKEADTQAAQIAVVQVKTDSYSKFQAIKAIKDLLQNEQLNTISRVYLLYKEDIEIIKK